jgi:hypothetical protein
VGERLHVNKLVHEVASWVASAVARRVELWEDTCVILPAIAARAARAAVLAFGDELGLNYHLWLSPGGRDLAAAYLLPCAEAALRQELLQSRCSDWPSRQESACWPELVVKRLARALTARQQ